MLRALIAGRLGTALRSPAGLRNLATSRVFLAGCCALGMSLLTATALAAEKPKVVIIGFDGADARLVEQWMDEGHLPNLAKLRDDGSYAPLLPTNPPQTPVSWASFATGTDPGKTEIFDFLKRNPGDYLPDFAMITEGKKTFLFGTGNGRMLGVLGGAAAFALVFLLSLAVGVAWRWRFLAAALLAVGAGFGVASFAGDLLPVEVPDATNNRKGETMWALADAAGLTARVIRVPGTFPAEPMDRGRMLSGLGVPDMRGRVGTPAFYTSDPGFDRGENEFSLELIQLPRRRGVIETSILGPRNKPFYDYAVKRASRDAEPSERASIERAKRRELDDAGVPSRIDVPMTLEVTDTSATIEVAGRTITLAPGEWSDWVVLDFPVNGLVDRVAPLRGMVRLQLLRLEPEIELYVSPINFHPDCHPVAFAWPEDWSETVADRFGLYKTIGWALDTWSLPSGVGDEQLFLDDMDFTVSKYEEIMEGVLGEGDADLYIQIFYFTDRIGHLYWRFLDTGHPLYDAAEAEKHLGDLLAAYQRMDRIVGKARELAGPDAWFVVCSDHGFSSFRRGVNYNNWLVDQGLMVLREKTGPATLEKLFDTRDLFGGVDWSRTKAYAMGLGSIYVNLMGRERNGIVLPGPEYDEVVREIKEGLEGLVDPKTGQKPVARVWTRDEMYSDYDADLIPDLRASNSLDYRVSWQTSLGGFGDELIEDNLKPWSGDHCSNEPELVKGILFSNRALNTGAPRMIDIMPSVLDVLGVEAPAAVDGRPLLRGP